MKNLVFILLFQFIAFDSFGQVQIGTDIDGEGAQDRFGRSVAISDDGTRVIVGAEDPLGSGPAVGHVRVLEYDGTDWVQIGGDVDAGSIEGYSVAISATGDTVAIGDPFYWSSDGPQAGQVRIYRYNGTSWVQIGSQLIGGDQYDRFGFSVSLSSSGGRLAVGSERSGGTNNIGHTSIYEFNGTNWIQLGSNINGEANNDLSGTSVKLSASGSHVVIGAVDNDGSANNAGHARVYTYNGTTWTQLGNDIDGEAATDRSGWSVSISANGQRVAIGARANDGTAAGAGHARVYEYRTTSSTWVQLGGDIDGEAGGDLSGISLDISHDGSRVAIGATHNDGNGNRSGHFRVYEYSGSGWTQVGIDVDGEAVNNYFGCSVSISADGSRVAAGAFGNNGGGAGTNAGHARVYEFTIALPVELVAFAANCVDEGVELTWQTASEVNNSHFEIQRSSNGEDWEHVGFEEGMGTTASTTDYLFIDRKNTDRMNYYRLKQFDFDGAYEFSPIRVTNCASREGMWTVFPNPTSGDVYFKNNHGSSNTTISFFDQTGRKLGQTTLVSDKINLVEEFGIHQPGIYTVCIESNQKITTRKIVLTP